MIYLTERNKKTFLNVKEKPGFMDPKLEAHG